MGRVVVPGPYNDQPLDADDMRAHMQVLADGINSVDQTQIADGSINGDKLVNNIVNLMKLANGSEFLKNVRLMNSAGVDIGNNHIYFDSKTGSNHATTVANETWTPVRTPTWDWRTGAGAAAFTYSPNVPVWVIALGTCLFQILPPNNGTQISYVYTAISNVEGAGDVARSITHGISGAMPNYSSHTLFGIKKLDPGQTFKPHLELYVSNKTDARTAMRVHTNPFQTTLGLLILPR